MIGVVSRPGVDVTLKLTTDVYAQNNDWDANDLQVPPNHNDFMDSLDKLLNGDNCNGGCNNSVVTCTA